MDLRKTHRKIVAWPLAHLCFWFGDLMARTLLRLPEWAYIRGSYQLYNKPMLWSLRLNDWAGLSLWSKPE